MKCTNDELRCSFRWSCNDIYRTNILIAFAYLGFEFSSKLKTGFYKNSAKSQPVLEFQVFISENPVKPLPNIRCLGFFYFGSQFFFYLVSVKSKSLEVAAKPCVNYSGKSSWNSRNKIPNPGTAKKKSEITNHMEFRKIRTTGELPCLVGTVRLHVLLWLLI